MNENITSPMIWQSKKEESLNIVNIHEKAIEIGKENNFEHKKRQLDEHLIKEDKNKNPLINNINNSEYNLEKETNSHTSLNITLNVYDKKFFEYIDKFVEYPKLSDLNITNENNTQINGVSNHNYVVLLILLKDKVGNLKYLLKNSFLNINNFVSRILIENELQLHSIANLRLEILVSFLKNPNIINIKRKILEVISFHLYMENSEYFQLNADYHPTYQNLDDLEKLIILKLKDDDKNEKIKKDLKIIQNEKLFLDKKVEISMLKMEKKDKTIIEECKKRKLNIAKNFIDFYKTFLNNPVHLGENTAKFYLLPRSMFNSEVKLNEYLFDLESIISDVEEKKEEIIELKKNKKEIELANFNIYTDNKIINIDEALNILFSFNSSFEYINNKTSLLIEKKARDFKKEINEYKKVFQDIFQINFNFKDDEKCTIFNNDINSKINNCANYFYNEILCKLYELIEKISVEKITNEKKELMFNIKKFIKTFIEKCPIHLINENEKEYVDINSLKYISYVKILILNRISEFFEKSEKIFIKKLEIKDKEYKAITKQIKTNLKELKKIVQKNSDFENDIYEQWKKKDKFQYESQKCSLEKIKKYLAKNINQQLNLEMKYTYDSKFCLWAIKYGFANYFTS